MRTIRRTAQFKRNVKRNTAGRARTWKSSSQCLRAWSTVALAARYRDHVLVGQYKGSRECHLEPDWLLIYESTEDKIILIRTGSHSDLFR